MNEAILRSQRAIRPLAFTPRSEKLSLSGQLLTLRLNRIPRRDQTCGNRRHGKLAPSHTGHLE